METSKFFAGRFCEKLFLEHDAKEKVKAYLMSLVTNESLEAVQSQTEDIKKCTDTVTWEKIDSEWLQKTEYFASCALKSVKLSDHSSAALSTYTRTHVQQKFRRRFPDYIKGLLNSKM